MRDSLPFAAVFTEYIDSHQGAASVPGGLQAGAHPLGVTESTETSGSSPVTAANWEPNTGCVQLIPESFTLSDC